MANVLLGWELGGRLGHVTLLRRLAQSLASHGHSPFLVVKDVLRATMTQNRAAFTVLQAPLFPARPAPQGKPFVAASYADLLAVHGFRREDELLAMVSSWQGLLDLVRPALVVCNHAPTLTLSAFGEFPTVLVGNGFTVPPVAAAEFPPLAPQATPQCSQASLLGVVQRVQRRRGHTAPETLTEVFAQSSRFITVFPELDPYRIVRQESLVGPLDPVPSQTPLPDTPRYFAYLDASQDQFDKVVGGLTASGVEGSVFVLDAPDSLLQALQRGGLEVYGEPPPLSQVLPHVSVVVHLGGSGTSTACLAAGRPQLLLPGHLEQALTAQALQSLGVAKQLSSPFSTTGFASLLRQLSDDPLARERAAFWSATIQDRGPCNALEQVTERCLEILATSE